MKQLSWEPIRDGEQYCSPACGGGCTIDEYLAANEAAAKLCEELGSSWNPRAWENLGWHYLAFCNGLQVRKIASNLHTANYDGNHTSGETPLQAVEAMRELLTHKIIKLQQLLDDIPLMKKEDS